MGVGHLTGELPLAGDLLSAVRGVRTRDHDPVERVDLLEQGLHLNLDLGIVDPVAGAEDDLATQAAADATEVLVEHVEAVLGLRVGNLERVTEGRANGPVEGGHADQDGHPQRHDDPAPLVAPATDPNQHSRELQGNRQVTFRLEVLPRHSMCHWSPPRAASTPALGD